MSPICTVHNHVSHMNFIQHICKKVKVKCKHNNIFSFLHTHNHIHSYSCIALCARYYRRRRRRKREKNLAVAEVHWIVIKAAEYSLVCSALDFLFIISLPYTQPSPPAIQPPTNDYVATQSCSLCNAKVNETVQHLRLSFTEWQEHIDAKIRVLHSTQNICFVTVTCCVHIHCKTIWIRQ